MKISSDEEDSEQQVRNILLHTSIFACIVHKQGTYPVQYVPLVRLWVYVCVCEASIIKIPNTKQQSTSSTLLHPLIKLIVNKNSCLTNNSFYRGKTTKYPLSTLCYDPSQPIISHISGCSCGLELVSLDCSAGVLDDSYHPFIYTTTLDLCLVLMTVIIHWCHNTNSLNPGLLYDMLCACAHVCVCVCVCTS